MLELYELLVDKQDKTIKKCKKKIKKLKKKLKEMESVSVVVAPIDKPKFPDDVTR